MPHTTNGGGGGGSSSSLGTISGRQLQQYSYSSSSSSPLSDTFLTIDGGFGLNSFGATFGDGLANACQGYIPFLLFLALEITVIGCVGAAFTKELPLPYESEKSLRRARSTLQKIVAIVMLLAAFTAAASVTEKYKNDLSSTDRYGLLAGVQGLFFLLLVFVASRKDAKSDTKLRTFSQEEYGDDSGSILAAPLMGSSINAYDDDVPGGNLNSVLAEIDPELKSFTLWQALGTAKFYLIFFSFFIGGGSGVMIISNLGQIIDGMTGSFQSDVTVFVTIVSVCNCWGRLLSGMLGDFVVKRGYPRPVTLWLTRRH